MLGTASFYDLLQAGVNLLQGLNALVPGLGAALVFLFGLPLTIWAWLTFYVWFKLHGVSFMQPKRFAIMSICGFADVVMNALPAWIAAVALLILTTRADELLAKVAAGAGVAGTAASVAGKLPGTGAAFKGQMAQAAAAAKRTATDARAAREQLAAQNA